MLTSWSDGSPLRSRTLFDVEYILDGITNISQGGEVPILRDLSIEFRISWLARSPRLGYWAFVTGLKICRIDAPCRRLSHLSVPCGTGFILRVRLPRVKGAVEPRGEGVFRMKQGHGHSINDTINKNIFKYEIKFSCGAVRDGQREPPRRGAFRLGQAIRFLKRDNGLQTDYIRREGGSRSCD